MPASASCKTEKQKAGTVPSGSTVMLMPSWTYSRNSSPSRSTTGMLASVQLAASMAPEAARLSMVIENSMHAGWLSVAQAV